MPEPDSNQEFTETRTDQEDWLGGASIDLEKEIEGRGKLKDLLTYEISTVLAQELQNQQGLIDNIERWQEQYRGDLPPKEFPYEGASNINIPITRWLIDTVVVRVMDVIFGQRKVWIIRAITEPFKKIVRDLEDGLEWWQKHMVKLREKIFSPLMQGIKMGTGIVFFDYKRIKRTVPMFATDIEKADTSIKKYRTAEGELLVKKTVTVYEGPMLYGLSREDWVSSSDSPTIEDAYICGYSKYYRRSQVESRIRSGLWYGDISEHLKGDSIDDTKKSRAETEGKEIMPFNKENLRIWKLHLRYDVDDDGEEDDIIVTWHQESRTILAGIYNPIFYGFRPFEKLVGLPVEYRFDGDGGCQILEHIQNEINSQHNQRIDKMNQLNAPMILIREGSRIESERTHPGKKWIVDDVERDIKMLEFPTSYYPSFQEEGLLNQYGEKSMGIAPGVMGIPTSERPVARETMALIQEANKKFKFIIDNIREAFKEIGMKALEMFAQYQPKWEFYTGEGEVMDSRTVDFPREYLRDGIKIDLVASSELLNQEVRREINMAVYTLLSDYVTRIAGMVQAMGSGQVPPAMFQFLASVIMMSGGIMREILKDFDMVDADEIIGKLEQGIDFEALQNQAQVIQQLQQVQLQQQQAMQFAQMQMDAQSKQQQGQKSK